MIEPRRIVVRGPNWLGDLVMAAPSIRAVADRWREATVQVAVPAAFAPLVPLLHPRVTGLGLEGGGVRALNRHVEQLRDGAFDLVADRIGNDRARRSCAEAHPRIHGSRSNDPAPADG